MYLSVTLGALLYTFQNTRQKNLCMAISSRGCHICWAATQLSQDADTSVRGKITAKGISKLYRGTQKKPQNPKPQPIYRRGHRDGRGRRRCPRRQRARVCRAAAPGGTPAAPRARRRHLPGAQGAARSPAAVSPRRQRRTSYPSPCGPAPASRRPLSPGAHRPGPAPRPLLRGRPPARPPRRRSPSPRRRRAAAPR